MTPFLSRLSAVAAIALALTIGVAPLAASAEPVPEQPGNLVVNGDGEVTPEPPVWVGGGLERHEYGVDGYPLAVLADRNGPTGAAFAGGVGLLTGDDTFESATQTIDLTPSAAAIDAGRVSALLSAFIGGLDDQGDAATIAVVFADAAGARLAATTLGPNLPGDRGGVSGFGSYARTQAVPVGTRQVVITISVSLEVGSTADGYVDNLTLVLDQTPVVAVPPGPTGGTGAAGSAGAAELALSGSSTEPGLIAASALLVTGLGLILLERRIARRRRPQVPLA